MLGSKIDSIEAVLGGDINDSFKIEAKGQVLFVKQNQISGLSGLLEKEVVGLELLRTHFHFKIPEVILCNSDEKTQVLVIEWIEQSQPTKKFWEIFGHQLAEMHSETRGSFGLNHNNYIGTIPQCSAEMSNWKNFLVECRLQPLIMLARDSGVISDTELRLLEGSFNCIETGYPQEPPSLVHGDLWSGNYLVHSTGVPVLIDPAVYYGHRFMDLAMMHLFGGFHSRLFDAYAETYAFNSGWRKDLKHAKLVPLLVHLVLFGRGYWSELESIIKRFV